MGEAICDHTNTRFPERPVPDAWYRCPDCGERVGRRGGRIITVAENNASVERRRLERETAIQRAEQAERDRDAALERERELADLLYEMEVVAVMKQRAVDQAAHVSWLRNHTGARDHLIEAAQRSADRKREQVLKLEAALAPAQPDRECPD